MTIDQLKKQINNQKYFRELEFDRSTINDEERTVEMSVSSEQPYERWFGIEILDHSKGAIRMERLNNSAALKDTHYGDQIGVVLKGWLDEKEKKLRVLVKFSKNTKRAEEIWGDVKDGIRKNVSIRYIIHELVLEKEVEDVSYYRVTDWEVVHVSMEPDPADITVGVGRGSEDVIPLKLKNIDEKTEAALQEQFKEFNSNDKNKTKLKLITTNDRKGSKMDKEELKKLEDEKAAAVERARSEGGAARGKEVAGILQRAIDYKESLPGIDLTKEAHKFVTEGKSEAEFVDFLLRKTKDPEATKRPSADIGLSDKEKSNYSLARAVLSLDPQSNVDAGYEREISQEYRSKFRRRYEGVITIPPDVLRSFNKTAQRDLQATAGSGTNLVGTDHLASQFIEYPRNAAVVERMGAFVLDGLVEDINIPVQTGAAEIEWVGEDTAGAGSDPGFDQRQLSPKTATQNTSYSRQLLLQSRPGIDQLVRTDLEAVAGLAVDKAALHGSGSANQPKGVANWTGVGSVNGANFNYKTAAQFKRKIAVANLAAANMGWIISPTEEELLKTRPKEEGYPIYLMGEDGKMYGYRSEITNQCNDGTVFFGDWSKLIIGKWGGIDLGIDPYTQMKKGQIIVVVFASVDVALRQPAAFSVGTGVN